MDIGVIFQVLWLTHYSYDQVVILFEKFKKTLTFSMSRNMVPPMVPALLRTNHKRSETGKVFNSQRGGRLVVWSLISVRDVWNILRGAEALERAHRGELSSSLPEGMRSKSRCGLPTFPLTKSKVTPRSHKSQQGKSPAGWLLYLEPSLRHLGPLLFTINHSPAVFRGKAIIT